jgi:hypothetical protein
VAHEHIISIDHAIQWEMAVNFEHREVLRYGALSEAQERCHRERLLVPLATDMASLMHSSSVPATDAEVVTADHRAAARCGYR